MNPWQAGRGFFFLLNRGVFDVRWFWIDRYLEFVSGSHATAIKNVSLSEPYVLEYSKNFSSYPPSLIIEGMAQTGGLLVNQAFDFGKKVVLAKVGKSVFHEWALPGDQLRIQVEIENMQDDGSMVTCVCHRGEQVLVEADLMFAYPEDQFADKEFFADDGLSSILRTLRIFEVGKNKDGSPIEIPPHFLQAERESIQQ